MKSQTLVSSLVRAALTLVAFASSAVMAFAGPVTLYAVDARGMLYSLNTGTQAVASIGSLGFVPPGTGLGGAYAGLDFNPVNNLLYVSSVSTGNIYTVNTATAATTLVTTVSSPHPGVTQNLAFSPSGVLYGSESVQLYTINLGTGAATATGSVRYPPDDNGLAFAPNGILYGVGGPLPETLYTINPTTNAVTYISASTPCWVGLTFAVDGNLYCTGRDLNNRAGLLYQLNPATGVATFLFDTQLDIADLANGAATPVPEPATLIMFGAGLLGVAAIRRRNRR